MLRLYIDTQIINNLQRPPVGQESLFNRLLKILKHRKNEFILLYSIGHLSDYKRDTTDHKNIDLKFMEDIGFNHFINYTPEVPGIYIVNASPLEVFFKGKFKRLKYGEAKSNPLYADFFSLINSSYKTHLKFLVQVEKRGLKSLKEKEKETFLLLKSIIPFDSKRIDERKYKKYFMKSLYKLNDGDKVKLKLFFNNIIKEAKQSNTASAAPIDSIRSLDFSNSTLVEELYNSEIQTYLIDRLFDMLNMKGLDSIDNLCNEFSISSLYVNLELTGLVNEPPRKFKINNMASDAEHATFSSYCNVLLTEDKMLATKSKIIYGALSIDTLVYTTEQFIDFLDKRGASVINSKDDIINLSQNEVYKFLMSEKKEFGDYLTKYIIKSKWLYLGIFNNMIYNSIEGKYYIKLIRLTNNFKSSWSLKEIQVVVEKCIEVFGLPSKGKRYFEIHTEWPLIQSNTWLGRKWQFDEIQITLSANFNLISHVSLTLGPFPSLYII